MEIKAVISRSGKDFDRAYALALKHQNKKVIFRISFPAIIVCLAIVLITNYGSLGKIYGSMDSSALEWMLVIIVSCLLWYIAIRKMGTRIFKRNPKLGMEEKLIFSEDGITSVTAMTELKSHWGNYVKAVVSHDMILLYPSNLVFNCFPRRFFTDEEFAALSDLVREKVTDTKVV